MYLYDVENVGSQGSERFGHPLAGLGESGRLQHFPPSDLVLTPDETLAVYRFFWPDKNFSTLGALTDKDREFAQALLVEAVDASCTMGIVEGIYRRFFMRVPTSFNSILKAAGKVLAKAIQSRWLKRCTSNIDPSQTKIYESVRVTLARNQRTVIDLRLQTGDLIY